MNAIKESTTQETETHTSLETQFKEIILHKLLYSSAGIQLSFSHLSHSVDLHPRTLQRRLKDEGTSFIQIKDEARFQLAKKYLLETRDSIEHIADKLDFSERTSFTRAFKRWSNLTPMQYRKQKALA